jgi:hypothetical protein
MKNSPNCTHDRNAIISEVKVDVVHRSLGQTRATPDQIGQAQGHEPFVLGGHTDQVRLATRPLQVVVHGNLQVGVLEGIELLGDHGQLRRLDANVHTDAIQ